MIKINEDLLKLQKNYLFSEIKQKVASYQQKHQNQKIISLGIGDVTRPLPKVVIEAMEKACKEMGNSITFKGYGPEQGYEFLREKIVKQDYQKRGITISLEEVFISDGAKCDCSNISDIFEKNNTVAILDPVYPVYLDSNVMSGRSGTYQAKKRKIWKHSISIL